MSILDVTEDQIFKTLGKGRDPNFKQIVKVRPVVVKPKKTYTLNNAAKAAQVQKTAQPQAVQVDEPVKTVPLPEIDEMKKLTEELTELNNRMNGLQRMVKWYIMPQFVIVLLMLFALFSKS